jgi:hypothetical protein
VFFIVGVALCVFLTWCVILCDMCVCVLCLIATPLPPGKNPFAVQLNKKKITKDKGKKKIKMSLCLTKH